MTWLDKFKNDFALDTGRKLNVQKTLYNVLCTFDLQSAFRDLVRQII